ncbi:GA4 desaturase [Daldinia caldariorum]|uniref:GA4 desaturase n=1 Tax=Daldinia caldariorum TaxID=326644 RepID=UPI002007D9C8|nr:GA4 desaturase [Daldinia caldariorum]KAI1472492.1 GA4 desaturase [Daldinia caldariorum]
MSAKTGAEAESTLLKELVSSKLRYIAPGHVPQTSPHNLHLPSLTEFGDERILPLHPINPIPNISELSHLDDHVQLHTHGFTAIHHTTPLHAPPHNPDSFKDPELLKQYIAPDTVDLMKKVTGCKSVIIESFLLRASVWTEIDSLATHGNNATDGTSASASASASDLETSFPQFIGFNPNHGAASPASKIHLDYSATGARTHIRHYHPGIAGAAAGIIRHEDALRRAGRDYLGDAYRDSGGPRWALYSVWRPLRTVTRDPLVVLGCGTVGGRDCVPVDVRTPYLGTGLEGTYLAEGLVARYSEAHKWYWIEEQKPEEVLVLRFFDSDAEAEGRVASGGAFHSSVEVPGTQDEPARESLEVRCLCIW